MEDKAASSVEIRNLRDQVLFHDSDFVPVTPLTEKSVTHTNTQFFQIYARENLDHDIRWSLQVYFHHQKAKLQVLQPGKVL